MDVALYICRRGKCILSDDALRAFVVVWRGKHILQVFALFLSRHSSVFRCLVSSRWKAKQNHGDLEVYPKRKYL